MTSLEGETDAVSNGTIVADFLDGIRQAELPAEVLAAAKMGLVDWVAVCIGARDTPEAGALGRLAARMAQPGRVPLLTGGTADAMTAALVNGSLSHCLDYDDTHIPTALHASGPTVAGVLALCAELQAGEQDLLKSFVVGFEVGASLGSRRLGVRLNESGWHSTAVLGRLGVAAAAAYLLGLDRSAVQYALGFAATQAGGLTASFGTMAKPFHAGKAAADGLLAARLAEAGLESSTTVLDSGKGLFGTIFQDRETVPRLGDLGSKWEILENSFKPYAACQLTHAPIDAALLLREKIGSADVRSISLEVNPLGIEIAGVRNARTPTEGRFSTGYCVALALKGFPLTPDSFVAERLADPELAELASRVSLVPNPSVERTAARLEAVLADGSAVRADIDHAFGSVGNPMGWPQLEVKFAALVEPVLGEREARRLYETLGTFENAGSLATSLEIVGGLESRAS